jgi:predicted nucleotidyltransferase
VTYITPVTVLDSSSSSDIEVVQLKKYFYVLRPLFMVRWLATHPRHAQPSSSSNLPPMDFEVLLSEASSGISSSHQELLLHLVKEKREGRLSSAARGPRISQLDQLIDQLFVEASLYAQGVAIVEDETFKTDKPPSTKEFNHLLYTTVLGS